jgi:protein O-mannosyl-transferase
MVSRQAKNKVTLRKAAEPASKRLAAIIAVGLLVLVAVSYLRLWQNSLVYYDDNNYIYENQHVLHGISAEGIKWAFTSFESSNWHPLTWLSHMLDVQLFGLHPAGHHYMNLAWHTLNTLLLFGLLRYATGRMWASAFAAAIFAVHPLHVESVAWAAERKDVLSTFFWLATTWAYLRYARQPAASRYLLVLALFGVGLLAKPMLVTLPVILLLLDYWPLERLTRQNVLRVAGEKMPMLLMAAASSVLTVLAQRSAIVELASASVATRFTNAVHSYCVYLWQTVWPVGLSAFYPHPQRPVYPQAAAGLLLLGTITAICLWLSRSRKYLITGWLWYVVTLIPVIGLVQVGDQGHADRYTYIPLIGIFIMVAWGIADAVAARPQLRPVVAAGGVVIVGIASLLTWFQVGYWKNDIALFSHATQVTKGNYVMEMKLADAYLVERKYDEAIAHARRSLDIKPMGHTFAVLGAIYQSKNDLAMAYEYDLQALKMNPDIVSALVNIGTLLLDMQRYAEAEQYLQRALVQDPYLLEAYSSLGRAQEALGKLDQAKATFTKAVQLNPAGAREHFSLAGIYAKLGDYSTAAEEFRRSAALQKNSVAVSNLAGCLAMLGRRDEAARAYEESLAIEPASADVHYSYAVLLIELGKIDAAMAQLKEALAIAPDNTAAKELYTQLSAAR